MPQVLPEGSVLGGRYVIEARLGDGAMGAVYRAKHVKFTRYFAIKILHKNLTENPKQVRRFEREAELAGRLKHTNVASVVDVGTTDDGTRYMAMEFAPGEALVTLLADGPLAEARVLDIAKQLCLGLQHAHEVGLIHRDLKPENVIIEHQRGGREIVRIVDWGVAILREDAADLDADRLTTKGIVVGTPHYMAPEQASGSPLDHRVDIFALGLTCYEMLTGKLPFEGSGVEVARANLQTPTPPMGVRVPAIKVDPVLEAIVLRMLEKDRTERPPTANAVRELFELYERDRGACAHLLGVEGRYRTKMPALDDDDTPAVRAHSPSQNKHGSGDPEHEHATMEVRTARKRLALLFLLFASILGVVLWVAVLFKPAPATAPPLGGVTVDAGVQQVAATPPRDAALAPPGDAELALAPVLVKVPPLKPLPPAGSATGEPAPRPPPSPAPPPPGEAPSGAEIAKLYAEVGRELRELEERKGMEATIDLWPRYRWIRLHEWITTPERRTQAADMLDRLRRDIRAVR